MSLGNLWFLRWQKDGHGFNLKFIKKHFPVLFWVLGFAPSKDYLLINSNGLMVQIILFKLDRNNLT